MAIEAKAMVSWSTFYNDVVDYLENEAPDLWRKIFRPLIQGIVIDQGKRWAALLGMTFDVQPLFARDWYDKFVYNMPFEILNTTKEGIAKLVDDALKEGWSISNMQNAIGETFDIWEGYRSERIARTETIRASNAGSTELFSEWGVKKQEWLSTQDDRTRRTPPDEFDHVEANGEVVNMGEPFMATGEPLMYPGDPAGSAGNTINCRCTVIPVVEGMEADKSLKYSDDQPRVPAGNPDGGQWTDGSGAGGSDLFNGLPSKYKLEPNIFVNEVSDIVNNRAKNEIEKSYESGDERAFAVFQNEKTGDLLVSKTTTGDYSSTIMPGIPDGYRQVGAFHTHPTDTNLDISSRDEFIFNRVHGSGGVFAIGSTINGVPIMRQWNLYPKDKYPSYVDKYPGS